jgi:hypothetical protein
VDVPRGGLAHDEDHRRSIVGGTTASSAAARPMPEPAIAAARAGRLTCPGSLLSMLDTATAYLERLVRAARDPRGKRRQLPAGSNCAGCRRSGSCLVCRTYRCACWPARLRQQDDRLRSQGELFDRWRELVASESPGWSSGWSSSDRSRVAKHVVYRSLAAVPGNWTTSAPTGMPAIRAALWKLPRPPATTGDLRHQRAAPHGPWPAHDRRGQHTVVTGLTRSCRQSPHDSDPTDNPFLATASIGDGPVLRLPDRSSSKHGRTRAARTRPAAANTFAKKVNWIAIDY